MNDAHEFLKAGNRQVGDAVGFDDFSVVVCVAEKEKFIRELKREFPLIKVEGVSTRKIRQLAEFYEFVEEAADETLPQPTKIPALFPKFKY